MPGKPSNPSRGYSFSGFSAASPSAQQPGPMIDQELDRLSASITATLSWANTVIADGGGLKPSIITADNFAPGAASVLAGTVTAEAQTAASQAIAAAASCTASQNAILAAIGAGPVLSFNGRTGVIAPQQADYDAFFVNNSELTAALAAYTTTANLSATIAPTLANYAPRLSPTLNAVDGVNAGGNITLLGAGSNRNLKLNNNSGAFELTDPANTGALSFVVSAAGITYNGYTLFHSGNTGFLPTSGGTLTGALTLPGDATQNLQAVPLQQVSKVVGAVQGAAKNLIISADGLSAPVSIWADELILESTASAYKTVRNVSLSLSLAVAGANGLDAGSVAVSSWYSLWVIYNPTTDTVASLAAAVGALTGTFTSGSAVVTGIGSTANLAAGMAVSGANVRPGSVIKSVDSSTQITLTRPATASGAVAFSYVANPTMPSGYTFKARVGMVYTESGANKYPLPFLQVGRRVRWVPTPASNLVNPRQMAAVANGSTNLALAVAAYVPPTSVILIALLNPGNTSNNTSVHPNANSGGPTSTTHPAVLGQNTTTTVVTLTGDILLETGNIYASASGNIAYVYALGYEDNL